MSFLTMEIFLFKGLVAANYIWHLSRCIEYTWVIF